MGRDVEHGISDGDSDDADGVEGREEIEFKPSGSSCGGFEGRRGGRTEGEIVGDVFVGGMVNEAV